MDWERVGSTVKGRREDDVGKGECVAQWEMFDMTI